MGDHVADARLLHVESADADSHYAMEVDGLSTRTFTEGDRVLHKRSGYGTITTVLAASTVVFVLFDNGNSHAYETHEQNELTKLEDTTDPSRKPIANANPSLFQQEFAPPMVTKTTLGNQD